MRHQRITLSLLVMIGLSGCSNHYTANDAGTNQQQCKALRSSCTLGTYDEWVQANGDAACSCQRHQSPHVLK